MFTAHSRPPLGGLVTAALLAIALLLVAPPAEAQSLVNINTASIDELRSLPGIGPRKAEAVVAYRDQNGPFAEIEQITEVRGIGPGIFENIREMITVDGEAAAPRL